MPPLPHTAPAVRCLVRLAEEASARLEEKILRAPPRDAAFGWKSAAVHPLQPLENEFQGIVRDATEGIEDQNERKEIEAEVLGRFYFFDGGAPRLIGIRPGEGFGRRNFPLPTDELTEMKRQLQGAAREMDRPTAAEMSRARVARHLEAAYARGRSLLDRFYALNGARRWRISPVAEADDALSGLGVRIRKAQSLQEFRIIEARLVEAAGLLERALAGVGSVQMFYVIEPFCLYRLLVRFRLESAMEISADTVAEASGELTSLLTNGHQWLSDWLRDKVVEIARRIDDFDPLGNVRFFLKGGRALNYFLGTPERGTSDWDTQILINPDLPPAEWYELFALVSNAVLIALEDFKLQLFMLLSRHAAQFVGELPALQAAAPQRAEQPPPADVREPEAPDPEEPAVAAHRANCKAELIDIGLPRYDSVEAREQWTLLTGGSCRILRAGDGIPYPDTLYYIDEYLMMIRQLFAGAGMRPDKATKRIIRLKSLLCLDHAARAIERLCQGLDALLPRSTRAIEEVYRERHPHAVAAKRALLVSLHQFIHAYSLVPDDGLRESFDQFFAENLPEAARRAPYPPDFPAYVRDRRDYDEACRLLADAIGYAQWVSNEIEHHFAKRGEFMLSEMPRLIPFLRTIGRLFDATEEWELQFATRGTAGAWLQSDYAEFAKAAELDPVTFVSAGLYSPTRGARPRRMLEVIEPLIARTILEHELPLRMIPDYDHNAIRLYWIEPLRFANLRHYKPLAVEVVAYPRPERPLLSFIWGVPVLSLRNLIAEQRDAIAGTEEYGRRLVMTRAAHALVELLTRADRRHERPVFADEGDNDQPDDDNRPDDHGHGGHGEGARDARNYLLLRSDGLAFREGGNYPPSYYPHHAHTLELTHNREALRRQAREMPLPRDGILDLLVVGRGHGGIGLFAWWSAEDLLNYFIQPLIDRGVRAKVIVLDFCLSGSLLPVFRRLSARDGVVVSAVYSITEIVMTTDLWTRLQRLLQARDVPAIVTAIIARMEEVSTDVTGLSHLAQWRAKSEEEVAAHLRAHPADQDSISIVRYLGNIAALLRGVPDALEEIRRMLMGNRNVGPGEAEIVALIPPRGELSEETRRSVEAKFRQRLEEIMTQARYGIRIDPVDRPLLDGDRSLWNVVREHWAHLLALAPDLSRCPTPFSLWSEAGRKLTLDSSLAGQEISAETRERIVAIEEEAPQDLAQIIGGILEIRESSLEREQNYLQR